MQLKTRAFGFAAGVLWGAVVLIVTLLSLWSGRVYGKTFLYALASIYPGYSITLPGALLGLCYGFVDGFIGGWLVAFLYNFFVRTETQG